MLESTYKRAGEPVLVALGANASGAALSCALLVAAGVPAGVYTLKNDQESHRAVLPDELVDLQEPIFLKSLELVLKGET